MTVEPGPLEGLLLIQPSVYIDERGWFSETFRASIYRQAGIAELFVQDNRSLSSRGVLRGLHYQADPYAQGKLVSVIQGSIWDVAVDLRTGPNCGRWFGLELSSENRTQFYIPPGFAHGFLVLSDQAEVMYKTTAEYHPSAERGIRWDDPDFAIDWPKISGGYMVSKKDSVLPFWNAYS
jgi:dTDP-4-dehydrorhamnose 3,5-epimerase